MKYLLFVLALLVFGSGCGSVAEPFSKQDQVRMEVQKICPVTGEKLGEHGTPLKAKVGEEELFYCCADCLAEKVNSEHLATVHANLAKAQGVCLVMKEPLPEDAGSVIVEGHVVFVCCPPCSKKIAAEPKKFLQDLNVRYAASLSKDAVKPK